MRAFAYGGYDGIDRRLLHFWKQPVQDGCDQARRMLEGTGIAGCGEDYDHPDQYWQPVVEKRTGFCHGEEKHALNRGCKLIVEHFSCSANVPVQINAGILNSC